VYQGPAARQLESFFYPHVTLTLARSLLTLVIFDLHASSYGFRRSDRGGIVLFPPRAIDHVLVELDPLDPA